MSKLFFAAGLPLALLLAQGCGGESKPGETGAAINSAAAGRMIFTERPGRMQRARGVRVLSA